MSNEVLFTVIISIHVCYVVLNNVETNNETKIKLDAFLDKNKGYKGFECVIFEEKITLFTHQTVTNS